MIFLVNLVSMSKYTNCIEKVSSIHVPTVVNEFNQFFNHRGKKVVR